MRRCTVPRWLRSVLEPASAAITSEITRAIAKCIPIAMVVGCYAPTAQDGVPCAANGECPTGQVCDPTSRRCFGELPDSVDAPVDQSPSDAAIDTMMDAPEPDSFVDTFGRADGDAIGNGWLEKAPDAWKLVA